MKAEKIIHRNQTRIKINFPYNREAIAKLRLKADSCWSRTMGAWHIPYTKEAYLQLKELFPEVETSIPLVKAETVSIDADIVQVSENKPESPAPPASNTETYIPKQVTSTRSSFEKTATHSAIEPEYNRSTIFLKIPKNETDIQFIRSFHYARRDQNNYRWTIPNMGKNLSLLLDYLQDRDISVTEHASIRIENQTENQSKPGEILVVNANRRLLKIYFSYHRDIVSLLKSIPLSRWYAEDNCWTMPYTEYGMEELHKIAGSFHLEFRVINPSTGKGVARKAKHPGYLKCPDSFVQKLKELRYSENTLKSYTDMFEEFINHYPKLNVDEIDDEKIIDFIRYLVVERKVSTSNQNQSINAIHPVGLIN